MVIKFFLHIMAPIMIKISAEFGVQKWGGLSGYDVIRINYHIPHTAKKSDQVKDTDP